MNEENIGKQFEAVILGDVAHNIMKSQHTEVHDMDPIETQCAVNCSECDKEIESNAVYDPKYNVMHYKCPKCNKFGISSNWLEHGEVGINPDGSKKYGYVSPWTDEPITKENFREHVVEPDPNKPRLTAADVWKEK